MGWVSFWVSCDDDPGEQNLLLSCRGATDQTCRTVEASHVSLAETKLKLSKVSQITRNGSFDVSAQASLDPNTQT